MRRIVAFLEDVISIWKKTGFRVAFRLVRSRVFDRFETLLYELRTNGKAPDLPAGWWVKAVSSEQDLAGVELLRRAGGGSELRYLRRGAVAYVMCVEDEPVARSWHFVNNPLARWLEPGAVYFGKMFVLPAWRGQGIQARLNLYMASLLPVGSRVFWEILPSNAASQKGVAKTGCVFQGRLHTVVFLGQVIRARVEAVPPGDNQGH